MKKQKIIITRKNGTYSIKGNGDRYLFELAKGAYERGEMQPTRTMKIKRFLRRLWLTYRHRINVMCDAIVGTPSAAEIEYIGLEMGSNKKAPSEAATYGRRSDKTYQFQYSDNLTKSQGGNHVLLHNLRRGI